MQRLLEGAGIVRHRGKIEAAIHNAGRACELVDRMGSLAAYFWRFEPDVRELPEPQTVSTSPASILLSRDFCQRGWKFVGPTTAFAFMQATGLVNDHARDCVVRSKAERARKQFAPPVT